MATNPEIILGLNIAIEPFSFCLMKNDTILLEKTFQSPYHFTENLILFLKEELSTLNKSFDDLKAIGITNGPGNYTSLRLGITTIKTIGMVKKIPIFGFSTLNALAEQTPSQHPIFTIIPARKSEYNASLFIKRDIHTTRLASDFVIKKEAILKTASKFKVPILIIGTISPEDALELKKLPLITVINNQTIYGKTLALLAKNQLALKNTGSYKHLNPEYSHQPTIGQKKRKSNTQPQN
ncbi:tRNA (adenosine(37)-N6)-threonylcarbamoyltransferase complex dimerization subunit type 1 TsaB [bacterium]|jgi:tRNA threonylcarbamoyl adenosine modification protein YeaZ|nr:tRNA (adenosine(37)-N6)-threonylcarbamoyltransferase complex dimerization subunit type 1 TsaB [bacterium]